jgi:hypothetical protein
MLNLCCIVVTILKMATTRNFSMSEINSGLMMSRIDFRHWKISTGRHFRNGHHNTEQIQHCPISTPKMADISKILKRRIAPLMVTYHYVKVYVSIIMQLEVININVQNFKFPIGFYSNPQNGRHNTAKIQHCPISSKCDMWVDNDVPN